MGLDSTVSLAAFVAVGVVVLLVTLLLLAPRKREETEPGSAGFSPTVPSPANRRQLPPVAGSGAGTGRQSPLLALTSEEGRKRMGDRLVQAGIYKRQSVGFYLLLQAVLAVSPVLLWLGACLLGWVTLSQALLYGILTGLLGVVTPIVWLDSQKRQRQTSLRKALPDALDVIVVCMEAGLSLPAAFLRVSAELRSVHPMLCAEFLIVQREIQMGSSTGEALRHFADRFDMEELRSLSSVVVHAEKFGSSIVQAVRVNADDLRLKRMLGAEEKAQKASVKLLIPTVLCIFPALFVVILGPAAFSIYELLLPKLAGQ